jgi:hypothetical protein
MHRFAALCPTLQSHDEDRAMAENEKVRRTVQIKVRTPGADYTQLLSLAKTAIPFFQALGGARVRLLRNVDDPTQFIQAIDYETDQALELNRHRIASDPMIQTYLQTWRTFTMGAVEVDVYEDVADGG